MVGLGFGLVADPVKKRFWGYRLLDPAAIADALIEEAGNAAPDLKPLMRRRTGADGYIAVSLLPLADDIRIGLSAQGAITVRTRTSALGPGYHAWLIDSLNRVSARDRFQWREDDSGGDETGYFADHDFLQLAFRFREAMSLAMGGLLSIPPRSTDASGLGLGDSLRPVGYNAAALSLRGPRESGFIHGAQGGAVDEARAFFPWWDQVAEDGLVPATAETLAEALLWTSFPWRSPLNERERCIGEVARALLNRAGPGVTGDIPVDELETLLASDREMAPRPDGPGYLRGSVLRDSPGGWTAEIPGYFHSLEPDDQGVTGWWFGGREVHVWTAPPTVRDDSGLAAHRDPMAEGEEAPPFDPYALLAETNTEISFVYNGCFYKGHITMHRGPNGVAPELAGEVHSATGQGRIWILFRGVDDCEWVLETFRSFQPEAEEKAPPAPSRLFAHRDPDIIAGPDAGEGRREPTGTAATKT